MDGKTLDEILEMEAGSTMKNDPDVISPYVLKGGEQPYIMHEPSGVWKFLDETRTWEGPFLHRDGVWRLLTFEAPFERIDVAAELQIKEDCC